MKKIDALKIIIECAKLYHTNLENKNLLIISLSKSKYNFIEAKFLSSNYLHLTGVVTNFKPNSFYNKCIQKKISVEDFNFKSDGTTVLKLTVLPQLMNFHKNANIIGDYNHTQPKLFTDKLAGNIRGCMGFDKFGKYYIPKTLLQADIRDITAEPERIIAIFSKNIKDELYNKLLYTVNDSINVGITNVILNKIDIDNFTYTFTLKKISNDLSFVNLVKNIKYNN